MKKIAALVPLMACFVFAADSPRFEVTKQNVQAFYAAFPKLYQEPHYVAPQLSLLCGIPSPEIVAAAKDRNGPHFEAFVNVYTNEPAFRSIDREKFPLPLGSIIVKEKLGRDKVIGIGGMIKREPGYDPANGDWEYFYSDTKDGFASGKLQNCSNCHARVKATDYVFSKAEAQKSAKKKP